MVRDRMERFVLLPFSVGCISESSIAVAVQQQPPSRRSSWSKPAAEINNSSNATKNREEDEESISSESIKSSFRFLPNSKPDLSTGFHWLCKGFKNLSQMFVYKEEEMEMVEREIEIGFPTDVKHVTHIGLDGCTTTTNNNSIRWENLMAAGLLSLGQFDHFSIAPAAEKQADDGKEEREALPAEALVKKKKKNDNNNSNNFVNQLN